MLTYKWLVNVLTNLARESVTESGRGRSSALDRAGATSMSVNAYSPSECIDKVDERFVPVSAPSPMTTEKLLEATDVHDDVGTSEAAVFAVAHQQGLVQLDADEYECEAMNVLYLTANGKQAVERWYLSDGPEDFSSVDRAFVVDEADLMPTGKHARRFAPITRRHPEVEN